MTDDEADAFVREHTELAHVPLVPEVRLFTATAVVPLWHVTEVWLAAKGVAVPFWSVPWAGGQGLARWLLDHPDVVAGARVVDFGAGSGLVGIAAHKAGARSVTAIDVDPLAGAACRLNARSNGVALDVRVADVVGDELEADLVVAGDVWYEARPAARFASWFRRLAAGGVRVLTGDPGRTYAPAGATELARYEVPTTAELESKTSRTTRVLELLGA